MFSLLSEKYLTQNFCSKIDWIIFSTNINPPVNVGIDLIWANIEKRIGYFLLKKKKTKKAQRPLYGIMIEIVKLS